MSATQCPVLVDPATAAEKCRKRKKRSTFALNDTYNDDKSSLLTGCKADKRKRRKGAATTADHASGALQRVAQDGNSAPREKNIPEKLEATKARKDCRLPDRKLAQEQKRKEQKSKEKEGQEKEMQQQRVRRGRPLREDVSTPSAGPSPDELSLRYLKQFADDRPAWRFQKLRQVWLLRHWHDPRCLSDEDAKRFLAYIEGLKGVQREQLLMEAKKISQESESGNNPEENAGAKSGELQLSRDEKSARKRRARKVLRVLS